MLSAGGSAYNVGDNFSGSASTSCGMLNETMNLEWLILDSNYSFLDSGTLNWTGATTYTHHNITSTALASAGVGSYTFYAEWFWWNGSPVHRL